MAVLERDQDLAVVDPDGRAVGESEIVGALGQADVVDDESQVMGRDHAADLVLHRLTIAIQILQTVGQTPCLVGVAGQQQLQCGARMAKPARGVDPGCQPEADLARVDRRRIDARNLHQCAQAGLLCPGERPQPGDRQRAVLTDERDDVGDRRQRHEIEVASQYI